MSEAAIQLTTQSKRPVKDFLAKARQKRIRGCSPGDNITQKDERIKIPAHMVNTDGIETKAIDHPYYSQQTMGGFDYVDGQVVANGNRSLRDVLGEIITEEGDKASFEKYAQAIKEADQRGDSATVTKLVSAGLDIGGKRYDHTALEEGRYEKVADDAISVHGAIMKANDGVAVDNLICGPINYWMLNALQQAGTFQSVSIITGNQERQGEKGGSHYTLIAQTKSGKFLWFNYGKTVELTGAQHIIQATKWVKKYSPNLSSKGILELQGDQENASFITYELTQEAVFVDYIDKNADRNMVRNVIGFLKDMEQARCAQPPEQATDGWDWLDMTVSAQVGMNNFKITPTLDLRLEKTDPEDATREQLRLHTQEVTPYFFGDKLSPSLGDAYTADQAQLGLEYQKLQPGLFLKTGIELGAKNAHDTDLFDSSYDRATSLYGTLAKPNFHLDGRLTYGRTDGETPDRETTIRTLAGTVQANWMLDRSDWVDWWVGGGVHAYGTMGESSSTAGTAGGVMGDTRVKLQTGLSMAWGSENWKLKPTINLAAIGDAVLNNPSEQRPRLAPGAMITGGLELSYVRPRYQVSIQPSYSILDVFGIYRKELLNLSARGTIQLSENLSLEATGSYQDSRSDLLLSSAKGPIHDQQTLGLGLPLKWTLPMGSDPKRQPVLSIGPKYQAWENGINGDKGNDTAAWLQMKWPI